YAWHHDGTLVAGWPVSTSTSGVDSPKLADLDNAGGLEIIMHPNTQTYVWYGNGTIFPGWPQPTLLSGFTESAVGDIDGDGEIEIAVTDNRRMYVWEANGTYLPGWPQYVAPEDSAGVVIPNYGGGGVILGDIDSDGDIELIGTIDFWEKGWIHPKVHAFHHDGTWVTGWPKLLAPRRDGWLNQVKSTPAFADLDDDGDIEVAVGGQDGKLYIWDIQGIYNESNIEWGGFQNNPGNTGVYDPEGPETMNVVASPNPTNGVNLITLTANVSDFGLGDSNVMAAEYFVDVVGNYGTGIAMTANDGTFNSPTEVVTQTIDISTWSDGVYTLLVHGQDAEGNWGFVNSTVLKKTSMYQKTFTTPGWQLISISIEPEDPAITSVLSTIAGDYDYVQYYDASDPADNWKTYATFKPPSLNDLSQIHNDMGIWINILSPCVLTMYGYELPSTVIDLYAGWNLVGYPTNDDSTYDVTQLMADTGATAVEGFNASAPYRIGVLPGDYVLQIGEGYWVQVPFDTTWTVNCKVPIDEDVYVVSFNEILGSVDAGTFPGARTDIDGSWATIRESGSVFLDVDTYVTSNTDTLGTTSNFIGAQSDADGNSAATLTEEIQGDITDYYADTLVDFDAGANNPTNAINPPDDQYCALTNDQYVRVTGSTWDSGSGTITKVEVGAEWHTGTLSNDKALLRYWDHGIGGYGPTTYSDGTTYPTDFTYYMDITADKATWTWTDIGNIQPDMIYDTTGGPDTYIWVDALWIRVTVEMNNYMMNIEFTTTGVPVANQYTLEINYQTSGEIFEAYVWNGGTWNKRGVDLTSLVMTTWSYILLPAEVIAGDVRVQYRSQNEVGDGVQDTLDIEYHRVNSQSAGVDYRYDVQFNTQGVPFAETYTLEIYYRVSAEPCQLWIYNFTLSGWEQITTLNSVVWVEYSYVIPQDHINGGEVWIRYIDDTQTADAVEDTIEIEYHRVNSFTA
ncbi:MAG: VCBS repeat-containing protein, partial [Thermoplasmata archaeon]|nr:VCBS repeat-containing protein [Thermoplasmata archaeon]